MKRFVASNLRFLVVLKRYVLALFDTFTPTRDTYAQHGEDEFILNILDEYDLTDSIYVDVGSNQPTVLSNTYLFYRHGYTGITIDANPEHRRLTQIVRPKDTHLVIGCAEEPSIMEFRHHVASVLSGFTDAVQEPIAIEHIGVMPLDIVMASFHYHSVFLLSIDVEGMDFAVLKGGLKTLERTLFLLVEENTADPEMRRFIEERGFVIINQFNCNILYKNDALSKELTTYP